mgnify:CR=1 FL=1
MTITEAASLIDDVEINLTGRLDLLKWVMVLIAMALAITQTVPITFGLWLLQDADSDTVGVSTTGE